METDVRTYLYKKTRPLTSKRAVAACLIAGFMCILALSFYFLYNAPDVGASFSWDGAEGHYRVASTKSWSSLRQGDTVLEIGDLKIGFPHLLLDCIYIQDREELFSWFDAKRQVFRALNKDTAVFHVKRDGMDLYVPTMPQKTGISFAYNLVFLHVIAGIVFFMTGLIVFYKKDTGEETRVFLSMSLVIMLVFISNAGALMTDIVIDPGYLRFLTLVNTVSLPLGNAFLFHLTLFLPKKRRLLDRFPWLILIFYSVCIAVISSFHIRAINSLTGTLASMTVISICYGFIRSESPLERQQMKWVFAGFFLGLGPWVLLNGIPILVIGQRLVDDTITGACVAFIPISMAFAIRKYRLMDIDSFLEGTFAYTLTLLLLSTADFGFLGLFSRQFSETSVMNNALLHPIIIIALYVVFRDRIGQLVMRLFKRIPLNESETIALFNRMAAGKGADELLQALHAVLREAFRLKDIVMIKEKDSDAPNMVAGLNKREGVINLWEDHGFSELTSRGLYIALAFPADKNREDRAIFLLGAVAGKGFYSRKDLSVLNSLYVQAGTFYENALLHERMLAETEARLLEEQRHEREKEIIIKDLHDGIGGIVSNIHLLSEMAAGEPAPEAARSALSTVSGLARDGLSEISGFLMSLDPEDADFDSLISEFQSLGNRIITPHGIKFLMESSVADGNRQTGRLLFYNTLKIYREALTNIVRHAKAGSVLVNVNIDSDCFVLTIKDDGTGILEGRTRGRGIANMKTRAREMGGRLNAISEKGLLVQLDVPLGQHEGTEEPCDLRKGG